MLKKNITYVNFDGEEVSEDCYFNLTAAEVMRLEVVTPGGFISRIRPALASNDTNEIFDVITKLILEAYGEKSPDGKRFIKSEEIKNAFEHSEAYSQYLLDITIGDNAEAEAAAFLNGVIPKLPDEIKVDEEPAKVIPQDHQKKKKANNAPKSAEK